MKKEVPKVISVINSKGGVGKSSTAIHVATGLSLKGYRVCLVDADENNTVTKHLSIGTPPTSEYPSLEDIINALIRNYEFEIDICHHKQLNIDFIYSTRLLQAINSLLPLYINSNNVLKDIFAREEFKKYDFIIVDCRAGRDILLTNAIVAANAGVIIPLLPETYSENGLGELLESIESVSGKVAGLLFNMVDSRLNIHKTVIASITNNFPQLTFQTQVPLRSEVKNVSKTGETVFSIPGGKLKKTYLTLVDEIVERVWK